MDSDTTPTPGTGNHVAIRGQEAVNLRAATVAARAAATRQAAELHRAREAAAADLKAQRAALEADFARRRAELEQAIAPLEAEIARTKEALWSVDLYLGRDEALQQIRDGDPAPADTPITIRQRVLVMAEESLILMDRKSTGMDADDVDAFLEWLTAAPENLDRVLPEPKGVVVLVPTKVPSDTGNVFEDAIRDDWNKTSWWILRNGERLYVLTVDPQLMITDRLLPRRDEFTAIFDQKLFGVTLGDPVEPGSPKWVQLEKQANARRRHYMRILMVLQGILDRTTVWHPLPSTGVYLLSVAAQDLGVVNIIQDDENSIQLTDGRESFAAWQQRLNKLLRPGLRVVGKWAGSKFSDLDYSVNFRSYHPRINPPSAESYPGTGPHLVEKRKDNELVIRYERTDCVWRTVEEPIPGRPGWVRTRDVYEPPRQRASCIIEREDNWVLPYDLATMADITYYLNSRDNRSNHFLSMVPVLRAALEAKTIEAEQEAPFRGLLADMLAAEGADPDTVTNTVDELVTWWKVANTWARPLNGEPAHEAKAAKQIVAEYRKRQQGTNPTVERVIAAGQAVPGVICVAKNSRGQWHAYAPSQPTTDEHERVFLDVTRVYANGTLGDTVHWQTVAHRTATRLHVGWATKEWGSWQFAANPHRYLTGPERDTVLQNIFQRHDTGIPLCVVETRRDGSAATVVLFQWVGDVTPADLPPVPEHHPIPEDHHLDVHIYAIEKDSAGVRVVAQNRKPWLWGVKDLFRHADPEYGRAPWGKEWRKSPVLKMWVNDDAMNDVAAWRAACIDASGAGDAKRRAQQHLATTYCDAITEILRARREAALHDEFVLDYGPDAEDLWEGHVKSLSIKKKATVQPHRIMDWVMAALREGEPVEGQTLGALMEKSATRAEIDQYAEYADVVIPPVDTDQR